MATLYNHSLDSCSDSFPVAPEVVAGGVVALAPHPVGIIITRDMIKTEKLLLFMAFVCGLFFCHIRIYSRHSWPASP